MHSVEYNLDWGAFSLIEFIGSQSNEIGNKYQSCIDIGSGDGVQTNILKHAGLEVFQLDKYSDKAEYKVDFIKHKFDKKFDVAFCSHVIEHQRNVGNFLDKIHDILNHNGVLIISAPKHAAEHMIEGHINCFITPYFIQHLIHAGFDLRNGKYLSCGGVENAEIVSKDPDFDKLEREEEGYNWTEKHHARSCVKLKNQGIYNHAFFHNCEIIETLDKETINLSLPIGYQKKGIKINANRWGLSFTL